MTRTEKVREAIAEAYKALDRLTDLIVDTVHVTLPVNTTGSRWIAASEDVE